MIFRDSKKSSVVACAVSSAVVPETESAEDSGYYSSIDPFSLIGKFT